MLYYEQKHLEFSSSFIHSSINLFKTRSFMYVRVKK